MDGNTGRSDRNPLDHFRMLSANTIVTLGRGSVDLPGTVLPILENSVLPLD